MIAEPRSFRVSEGATRRPVTGKGEQAEGRETLVAEHHACMRRANHGSLAYQGTFAPTNRWRDQSCRDPLALVRHRVAFQTMHALLSHEAPPVSPHLSLTAI